MPTFLDNVVLLLGAAVVAVTAFRALGLPPILAYLLLGILIGPHGLALLADAEQTAHLAEFGIMFLLFTVGLEFSLPQLMAMRRTVFGFGALQVGVTIAVFTLPAVLAGLDWRAAFALGAVLAQSSTSIVSKLLSEKFELSSMHGRQIMGVVLFQDLAVVALLVVVPTLAKPQADWTTQLGWAFAKAALALFILLWLGKKLMRPWFHFVARQKSSELFVLNVLLVTLGLAWVTFSAGLSAALGALLAGVLISETEYRYQVEDYIKPFRDVLLGLFFVSVGMLLDMGAVLPQFGWVVLMLAVLLAVKFVVIWLIARVMGNNSGVSLRTALALAPAGEFGFVLLAQAAGLISPQLTQIVLAAMLISMMIAPLIIANSERIVLYFAKDEWMMRAVQLHDLAVKAMATQGHVIVCGYGRSGQNLARLLAHESIDVVALDVDPQRVRAAAAGGESVVFGDAARREVLVAAGIHRAAALVISFADVQTALRILQHARDLEPALPVIVRTHDDTDIDRLQAAGAAEVVPEIIEGSLMLASHTMLLLGTPLKRVLERIRDLRRERYQLMRGFYHGATDTEETLEEAAQPRLHSILLSPDAYAVGKRAADLGLAKLGVEITALRRRNQRGMTLTEDYFFEPHDVLVLLGAPQNLALAEERLLQG